MDAELLAVCKELLKELINLQCWYNMDQYGKEELLPDDPVAPLIARARAVIEKAEQ